MKFTDIRAIDSIMSICVAVYILINAFKNFKEILDLFLEKTPKNISIDEIKKHLKEIKEIVDVHHIYIWSMDGITNYSTLHILTEAKDIKNSKHKVREEMRKHGIAHTTIEIEDKDDVCSEKECNIEMDNLPNHYHHH